MLFKVQIILFSLILLSFATSTKPVRKKLSDSLYEVYHISESNKKLKHGLYEVFNEKNKLIVKGQYNNGMKDGIWQFYNDNGRLVQKYDYSQKTLVFYNEDTTSIVKSSYELMSAPKKGEEIDVPFKIGGDIYGLNLVYSQKNIPAEIFSEKMSVVMTYIFTVSETGKLEGWTVMYKGATFDKTIKESIKHLPADAYEFSPAKINGIPVKSKVIYSVNLNYDMTVIPRLNYVVTPKGN